MSLISVSCGGRCSSNMWHFYSHRSITLHSLAQWCRWRSHFGMSETVHSTPIRTPLISMDSSIPIPSSGRFLPIAWLQAFFIVVSSRISQCRSILSTSIQRHSHGLSAVIGQFHDAIGRLHGLRRNGRSLIQRWCRGFTIVSASFQGHTGLLHGRVSTGMCRSVRRHLMRPYFQALQNWWDGRHRSQAVLYFPWGYLSMI